MPEIKGLSKFNIVNDLLRILRRNPRIESPYSFCPKTGAVWCRYSPDSFIVPPDGVKDTWCDNLYLTTSWYPIYNKDRFIGYRAGSRYNWLEF